MQFNVCLEIEYRRLIEFRFVCDLINIGGQTKKQVKFKLYACVNGVAIIVT